LGNGLGDFIGQIDLVASADEAAVKVEKGRPMSAAIAGEPSAVGGEDDVDAECHKSYPG
jgi:hypothetical protein